MFWFWKKKKKPQTPPPANETIDLSNPMRDTSLQPSTGSLDSWIPFAIKNFAGKMPTRGEYDKGHPLGAVVHFTAGWNTRLDPKKATKEELEKDCTKLAQYLIEGGIRDGYTFLVIDYLGRVYQNFPLEKWGYHAGKSYHPNLGYSVSNKLIGIEVMCPGQVTPLNDGRFKTNFGHIIDKEFVRYETDRHNIHRGYYAIYSQAQEDALFKVLRWLHSNGKGAFNYDYVLGHDEVAPDRKNDPGASLSLTMPNLRLALKTGKNR